MLANRRRDTGPELAVRRILHRAGLRYRVDSAPVPRLRFRADIVFSRARVAVFIDGCYWHMCPQHFVMPVANLDYWQPKLERNVLRDRQADELLRREGWEVLRFWEHESPTASASAIIATLAARVNTAPRS